MGVAAYMLPLMVPHTCSTCNAVAQNVTVEDYKNALIECGNMMLFQTVLIFVLVFAAGFGITMWLVERKRQKYIEETKRIFGPYKKGGERHGKM